MTFSLPNPFKPFRRRTIGKFRHIGSSEVYETRGAALSRDGRIIATASEGTVHAWSLPGFKEVLCEPYERISVWDVAISPDGNTVALGFGSAIGDGKGGFELWNVAKQKREFAWNGVTGSVVTVQFSPDGSLLACAGADMHIRLWDVTRHAPLREWQGHGDPVASLCFSPDGARLFSSDRDIEIVIWEVATGQRCGSIGDSGDCISLSTDGAYLAVAPGYRKMPGVVRVWEVATGKLAREIDVPAKSQWTPRKYSAGGYRISSAVFSRDGSRLCLTAGWPGFASLWDWREGKELLVLDPGGYEFFEGASFLPDGKSIAVTGRGFEQLPLIVWDISEAQ